jgi:hypothetical protein
MKILFYGYEKKNASLFNCEFVKLSNQVDKGVETKMNGTVENSTIFNLFGSKNSWNALPSIWILFQRIL